MFQGDINIDFKSYGGGGDDDDVYWRDDESEESRREPSYQDVVKLFDNLRHFDHIYANNAIIDAQFMVESWRRSNFEGESSEMDSEVESEVRDLTDVRDGTPHLLSELSASTPGAAQSEPAPRVQLVEETSPTESRGSRSTYDLDDSPSFHEYECDDTEAPDDNHTNSDDNGYYCNSDFTSSSNSGGSTSSNSGGCTSPLNSDSERDSSQGEERGPPTQRAPCFPLAPTSRRLPPPSRSRLPLSPRSRRLPAVQREHLSPPWRARRSSLARRVLGFSPTQRRQRRF